MAKLYFNYGAMASGKTTDLIETAYKYNSKGNKALVMKSAIDTKGGSYIVSRIGLKIKADIVLRADEKVFDYLSVLKDITCLIVEEAEFLTEDQIFELFVLTKKNNIPVICYGLKADFQTNSFPGSKRLFELADELNELVAICACGKKARFNARKINGEFVSEGPQVLIGADEAYEPLCGNCYLTKVLKK